MVKKKSQLLLGAHMSIAGGLDQALLRGASIGCTAIQIFTHSNRQWAVKKLTQENIDAFINTQKQTGITHVVVHASYLINLGSKSAITVKKSVQTLQEELTRCNELGIPYLVLHPGSGLTPAQDCIKQIAQYIDEILDNVSGSSMILIENMAGQGSSVGYTFEQLASCRSLVKNKKRVGFCFDTCHGWTSGYDFSTEKNYQKMWEDFDSIIGLSHLKAMHMNDSKKPVGSRVDRHEHIGKGTMGLEPFKLLMNDERFFDIPKILETPKAETDLKHDEQNMETLKNLLTAKNRKLLDHKIAIVKDF